MNTNANPHARTANAKARHRQPIARDLSQVFIDLVWRDTYRTRLEH
jgi:hypothetical protein